jgi:FPC/CPF motif-containing protein YcgG
MEKKLFLAVRKAYINVLKKTPEEMVTLEKSKEFNTWFDKLLVAVQKNGIHSAVKGNTNMKNQEFYIAVEGYFNGDLE